MKKKIFCFLLCAGLVFGLCGCEFFDKLYENHLNRQNGKSSSSEESSVPEPVEIDTGWPVSVAGTEINSKPERVAAVSPALAEYIYDMGLFDNLCAVGEFCAFSEKAAALPNIGSAALPDFDEIKAAEPQYILTNTEYDEASLIKLQQMNITVLYFEAPQSFDGLCELYKELALFFLGAEEGPAFGEAYAEKYNSALAEVSYSGEKASAAFIRGMDNIMITGDSLCGELLSRCFVNAAGDATGFEYPLDAFSDLKPDIIFVSGRVRLKDLEGSDLYRKKAAVKNDRVYLADLDAVGICSLRSFSIVKDMMTTAYDDYSGGDKLEVAYPSMYK